MHRDDGTLSVALWATNVGKPIENIEHWLASVDENLGRAANDGVDVLVMPEYAAEQWLSFAPPDLGLSEEIDWLVQQSCGALEGLKPLPARHGVALLAGTFPVAAERPRDGEPPVVNRAHLMFPDGRVVRQDKLCLTPAERNPDGWHLSPGDTLHIVTWHGVRLAILVCLDIELPALAARLAEHQVDIVLVPSMTESIAGYNRVFSCAKARATELFAAVCAVGCIGTVARPLPRTGNTSGAAAYLPCDRAFSPSGVAAELPPIDRHDNQGPVLVVPDLPIERLRELRRSGAEVWPGAWQGRNVSISDDGS